MDVLRQLYKYDAFSSGACVSLLYVCNSKVATVLMTIDCIDVPPLRIMFSIAPLSKVLFLHV